ncbi:transmembrane protein 25 isoform X1 [Coregonus clupeaformis]|uniref:transmembrane protein 25 isoform X1 n=1 Tax=Coregonus clupeaformis TaxID=59861 RepID=UPI001BE05E14|nr:transmembrane protein 25 isoform X1 [Coregonus clupeaformis]
MEDRQAESSHHHLQTVPSRCVLVVLWTSMECVCLRQGPGTTVLLLHTLAWAWTGAIEHAPKIDGRHRAALTLKENVTHKFNCQSEGWNPHAPPLLTWYLNGERQRQPSDKRTPGRLVVTTSQEESGLLKPDSKHNSTFSLRARKWDRELVCAASSPHSGESYNATVTLNVQFQPEILRVNAHYTETSDPGLSLVLFALVRSNPPAHITWVDQSGQLVANTSDFLVLDLRSYPWLTNHTLRVALSSLPGNVSVNASNSVGAAQSNLALAEFLQSRVEVPVLGILTGGAVGFITLLFLSLLVLCLLHKNKGKAVIDEPVEIIMAQKCIESPSVKVDKINLPRENMSLPSNMQLNDLSTLRKAREAAKHHLGEKMREEEEDLSAAYAARGFARYPMVGYIYKVNSKSSDEIWL